MTASAKSKSKPKTKRGTRKQKIWSRRPLSSGEIERRYSLIMEAKRVNRRASLMMLATATGLTKRQVLHTLNIMQKPDPIEQDRCGFCPNQPATCGPCQNCVSVCQRCLLPITRDQSYTKVMDSGREIKVHLACADA